jgi:hypothetical protein
MHAIHVERGGQWLAAARMRKALLLSHLLLAFFVQFAITSVAGAKGPYGNIHVGQWKVGAFTETTRVRSDIAAPPRSTAMASSWWSG